MTEVPIALDDRERTCEPVAASIEESDLDPGMQRLLLDILTLYTDRPAPRVAGPGTGQKTAMQLILDHCNSPSNATHEGVFGPITRGSVICGTCGRCHIRMHRETFLTMCCGSAVVMGTSNSEFDDDGALSPGAEMHFEILSSDLPDEKKAHLLRLLKKVDRPEMADPIVGSAGGSPA